MKILFTVLLASASTSLGSTSSDGDYGCNSEAVLSLKRTEIHPVKKNSTDVVFYASLELPDGSTSILESLLFSNGSSQGFMISDEDYRAPIGQVDVLRVNPTQLKLTFAGGTAFICQQK